MVLNLASDDLEGGEDHEEEDHESQGMHASGRRGSLGTGAGSVMRARSRPIIWTLTPCARASSTLPGLGRTSWSKMVRVRVRVRVRVS